MSFLEKLKGKSHNVLDKEDNSNYVISKTSSHHNVFSIGQTSATFSPALKSNSNHTTAHRDKHKQTVNSVHEERKNRVSPFHVIHNFYLDELEKEQAQRQKFERETRQRLQNERKKRMQAIQKLKESGKLAESKFKNKDWVHMGGLGPNTGTQQWLKKTELHNKMMKFSKEIKKVNFEKLKHVPMISNSSLQNEKKKDARSLGIQYSRRVPLPKVMAGQRVIQNISRSESHEQLDEMERLDQYHMKYMEMMKKM